MDMTFIVTIISIILGFLFSSLSYLKIRSGKKERFQSAKKEIISTFARIISEGKIKLTPELIRKYISSKERQQDTKGQLLRSNIIIEIFEDLQREFMENFFIPHETKQNFFQEITRIIQDLEKTKIIDESKANISDVIMKLIFSIIISIFGLFGIYQIISIFSREFEFLFPVNIDMIISVISGILAGGIIISLLLFREEKKEIKNQIPILEDMVSSTISKIFDRQKIKKNENIRGYLVDYLIDTQFGKVPIEVKYGDITVRSIKSFIKMINELNSNMSILITNSFVTDNAKNIAKKYNITLIENIKTSDDLSNNFTKIFKK